MKTKIGILLIIALVALSLPALGQQKGAERNKAIGRSKGPAQISLGGASAGVVDFSHKAHRDSVATCETCHHMGVGTGTCGDCHNDSGQFMSRKDAMHESCIGCHGRMTVSGGDDCAFCHAGGDIMAGDGSGKSKGKDGKSGGQ